MGPENEEHRDRENERCILHFIKMRTAILALIFKEELEQRDIYWVIMDEGGGEKKGEVKKVPLDDGE